VCWLRTSGVYLEGEIEVGGAEDEQVVAKQFVEFETIVDDDAEVRRTRRHAA